MIITFNFIFRFIVIVLILMWEFYWVITEQVANRERPKKNITGILGLYKKIRRSFLPFVEVVLILQLLGLQLFPLSNTSFLIQLCGFIMVIAGIGVAISARKTLGINWVPAADYQVKEKQDLVTAGIYAYIRHPIYLGVFLIITGGELVAQSYLVLIGLLIIANCYWQACLEERLLLSHFGNSYKTYMKRTKMFLPYLW